MYKAIVILFLLFAVTARVKAQSAIADTTVYSKADKEPEYPGGEKKFYKFLVNTIRYPAHARETNTQGRVVVSFIVETDGALTNLKVIKGVAADLDAEALRVIALSPKWIPAKKDGKAVRVLHEVPIHFGFGG